MPKFDRESETHPDLALFPCPGCRNERGIPQGSILATVWSDESRHRSVARRCEVCLGAKHITRERLAWYKTHGG